MKKIYFESYEEDVIKSSNQDYKLKNNYKWINNNVFYKFFSYIVYYVFLFVAFIYSKLILRISVKNKKALKGYKNYYIYSNHTLQYGDVFNPFIINFPRRCYVICSPSNLGIPIIGRLLPFAGALPIPDDIHKKIKLFDAMSYHIKKGHPIIIYPESHLWPYFTKIRECNNTSFHFPVNDNADVFVFTTTFQKRKFSKKPKITIYIDGPFNIDSNLSKKENIKMLHDKVYETMLLRSKLSTYEYIKYEKKC